MIATAIIVAAGRGERLGGSTAKAFVKLGGVTLLARALRTLNQVDVVKEVVVAVPAGMETAARAEAALAPYEQPVKIVAGGVERQDSVRIALALTRADAEVVIIHDAARPFATVAMFNDCLHQAIAVGAAIVATPVADTLKQVDRAVIRATMPRAGLWQAQTPQAFRRPALIRAHERAVQEGIVATDDADLVQQIGIQVAIVSGSSLNFKVTTPADLKLAEAVVAAA